MPFLKLAGHWTVAIEGIQVRDLPFHLHSGFEYCPTQTFALRAGYMTGYATRAWTGGFGLVLRHYRADYSYMPFQSGLGDMHRLTIGFTW